MERAAGRDRADARDSAWYQFLVEIENVLATGGYTWAEPTLRGIQATVTRQRRVTAAQRRAVAQIEARREPSRRVDS